MPLNPLLGKKILSVASDSTLQKTQILLQLSIQSNLYHYSKNKLPVYYLGKKNQQEFEVFLTSPEFEQFKQELETTLAAMITWVEKENILLPDNVDGFSAKESLSIFLDRLKSDFYSNRRIILYSDGKKNLEIIAVLIQNTDIDPELRRLMMINLLSDEGLLHCADGCFTRIQMTALQLQEHLSTANQPKQWLRLYITGLAQEVAANSPLGIWPSYQVLLCQLIEYSPVEIEIHANRYLLTQARLEGLPIDVISDPGIRLFKTMDLYKKTLIVNDYMHALYEKLTPFELTYFFSTQFHQTFLNIIETSSSFIQQKERILNQLNLLGSDKGFQLEEIFSFNDGTLRSAEALLITVSERLLQRSWLVVEASRKIKNDGNEYRMFSGCILLSWISIEQQRIRLVSFLGQKNALLALEIFLKNNFAKPKLDYFISYLTDLNQLLAVMHPTNKQVIWQWVDQTRIIDFVKKLKDARPLVSLLGHLPEAMQLDFIKAVGDKTIRSLVQESLMTAFKSVEKYTLIAKDLTSLTGLVNIHEISGMTSDFFRTLLAKQFYFFKKIEFPKIYPVIYLHHLDFSGADLREATFSASILDCQFDEARLDNVAFFNKLEKVSFLHTDLRKVLFYSPSFSEVDVRGAVFSSSSFQAVKEKKLDKIFSHCDLREVNFQRLALVNGVSFINCDFSQANFERVNLQNLNFFGASFKEARLVHADLRATNLAGASLQSADLSYARLTTSLLSNSLINAETKIRGAQLNLENFMVFVNAGVHDFSHCILDLRYTNPFSPMQLTGLDFSEANFVSVINIEFKACDFSNAFFGNGIRRLSHDQWERLSRLKFDTCNLNYATFKQIKLSIVNFKACQMQNINFAAVELTEIDFKQLSLLGYKQQLRHAPLSTSLSGEQIHSEARNIQSLQSKQDIFIKLLKLTRAKDSSIKLQTVQQGWYLPAYGQAHVAVDGRCVAITYAFSIAYQQNFHEIFLKNLQISSELYQRYLNLGELSRREVADLHAFDRALVSLEQGVNLNERSLPDEVSEVVGRRNFHTFTQLMQETLGDFFYHLVLKNHVIAVYRKDTYYSVFDTNSVWARQLTSLSELSIFFKKIISSYALVNHSFLVEKINFKQHIASLPLFFTQALESERTRLARQDKSMGPLMLEGESYTRVQLYDLGAQFYPQTIQGPGYLIDAELKISSEMLSDLIKNNRLSLRAKRCLSVFRRDYTRQALFISLLKLSKKILLVGSQPLRNKIYQLQAKLSSSGGYFAHNDIDSQNGLLALLNQERDEILSLLGEKGIIKSKPLIKNLIRASVSFQWLSSVYFLGNAAWQRDTVGVLLNTGEITLSFFSPLLEAKLLKLAPDKLKQLRFGKPMLRTFAVLPGSFFDVLGMVLGSIELSQAEYGSKAWRDSIASIAISGGSLIMTGSLAATSASTGVGVAAAVLIIIVSVTYSGSSAVIEYKAYPLSADQKFRLFWHGAVAQPVPQDVSLVRTQFDKYKAMAKQAWDYLQMRYLQDGMSNACAFGLENDEKTVIDLRHKQWQYPDNVVPDITELDGEIICQPAYQGIPEQRYHNEKQYGFYCENAAVLTLAESRVIKNNTKPCMHIMLNNIKTGVIHASSFWENIFLVNHLGNTTLFAADDTSNLFFLLDMRFNGEIRSGRNALNILDSRQLVGSLFFYIKPYFLAFGLMEEAANQFVIQQFQQSPTRFMLEYRENTVFVEELNYFIGRTGRTDYISCQSTETNLQVESGGGTAIYPDRIEACTRVVLSGYMQVEGQFSQEIIYYVKPSLGTTSLFISAPQVYLIFSDSAILQELSQLRYYPRENKLIFEVSIASESHIEPSKQQSFHLEINNYLLENQTSIFNFVDKYKNIIQVELLEQLEGFFKEKEATEKEAFIEIAHFSLHAETTLQDRQAILNQSQLILKSKPQYRVYNILKVKNSITLAVESVYIFATQQADIIPLNKKISFAQGKAGADIYSMDIESLQHNGSYFIDNNAIDNNLDIITLPIAIETIQVERRQDDLLLIPDREMSSCKIHVLDYFKAPCYQHFAILDSQKNLWYPEVNRLYSRLIPYYHSVYSQMPVIIDKAQMVKHAHVVIEAPLNSTSFYREKFDLVLAYEKFIIFFSDFFLFDKSWKDLQIYFSDASYLDYLNLNELSKWSIDYQQFLQNTYTQLIKSYWLDFSEDKLVEIYHNQRWLDSTHETSHSINEKKYQLGVVQLNLVSSYVEVKSVENDLYFYFNSANAVLIIKNWQEPSHRISRIKFRQANQLVFDNLDKYSFSDIQALQIYINEKILAYYLRQILDHYDKNLVTEFTVLVASQGLLSQVDAISDCLLFKNQFDLKEFVQNYVKFHASEPLQSLRLPKNSYLLLDILFLRFQLGYLNTNSFEKVSACFPFLPKERITFFLKKMHASRTNRPERTIQILASFFTGQRPELLNSLLSYLDIVLVDKQQILTNTNSSSPVGLNTTSREKRSLRATAEWDFLGGLQLVSTLFFRQTGRKFYVAREQTGLSYFESTVKALMIVEKIKVSLPNFYLNKIEEEEHLFIQLQADLSKKIFQQASLQSINKLINNFIKDLSNSIESLKRKLFILKLKESFLFEAEETSYIKKEKKLKQNKGLSPFTCVAVSFKSLFFSNPVCLETAMEKTLSNGIIKATAQGHLI